MLPNDASGTQNISLDLGYNYLANSLHKKGEYSVIVKVGFDYEENIEYMICHAKVGRNIKQLQRDFWIWLYNRENQHPYWEIHYQDDEGNPVYGVSYGTEAFVYWLNNVRFTKRKKVARLIAVPKTPFKKNN